MAAVAEGFVEGMAAAAEGDAVADLVQDPFRRLDGDAAANPYRAVQTFLGVFDDSDGWFEYRLDCFFRSFIPHDQAP